MQANSAKERRQTPRKLVELEVSISCNEKPCSSHTFAVYDLSLSGMAIYSETLSPEMGDKLCLCLSAKNKECSRDHVIEATVVHLKQDHVGIQFDCVGVHVLKDIQYLLRDVRSF